MPALGPVAEERRRLLDGEHLEAVSSEYPRRGLRIPKGVVEPEIIASETSPTGVGRDELSEEKMRRA